MKHFFTAAHCIQEKGAHETFPARFVRALFGAHALDDCYESERFALSPKKITIHKDWNPHIKSFDADIALLEFEKSSLKFNDYVQPICLWNDLRKGPLFSHATVVGWGQSEDPSIIHENEPKVIEVPIQSNEYCLPGQEGLAGLSSIRSFCAGPRNGTGVCRGDSGGGLVVKANGLYHLKGIVSASLFDQVDFCDVYRNAIYTNVLKYMDWIAEITGGGMKCI